MAEEETKEEGKEEEGEGKKKKNLILFIVIGVLVLLLLIGGAVAFLMLSGEEEMPAEGDAAGMQQSAPTTRTSSARSNLLTVGPMYPMDQFIVNLLSQSGRRYLKTTINLELDNGSLAGELDSKTPVVRDIIIGILSAKTIEEISTAKGKDKLKEELVIKLNEVLVDGQLVNMFFTDFVIQ